MNRFFLPLLLIVTSALLASPAFAEDYLSAEPMSNRKIRMDGMLREWPGDFAKLKTKSGSNSKNSALIGYDKNNVYVAAKIKDAKIIRTGNASKGEDHLSISIYFPAAKGRSHRIDVYPGDPGKKPALVKVDGRKVTSAKAIEAPNSGGFSLEAKIPWSALPAAKSARVGMRGKITYSDASSVGRIQSITATSRASGAKMPPLTLASETGLIQSLLEPKALSFTPAKEAYGDLTGKGGPERVAVYGHFLSVVGPGYKGGKQFYFNEMDVVYAKQVTHLSLRDFNGDGKKEIVLQKQIGTDDKYREVIQILQIGRDGAPLQVFLHEVAIATIDGQIKNKVSYSGSGSSARVKIEQGSVNGYDAGNYQEPTFGEGVPSALLPWQTVKSRSFAWKGSGLAAVGEESWEPKLTGTGAASGAAVSSFPKKKAPPPPRAPSADELLDRVYGLYKQDRGVSRGKKPSFDFVTDVVEDEQMERVLIHERDLVVFGKGFKKGLSYTYLTIGVKEPGDILSVTTRDLVGDEKAEIIVHAVLDAQASESLGGDVVSRQALFVYKVVGESLKRIFAAETARSLKGKRIMSSVAFIPNRDGSIDFELRPLRALGWTRNNYPFPEDQHPAGGLEPLLLPWTTVGARRYRFAGSEYSLQ